MQVERFLVGTLMMVNCYVVYDGDEAVIVDPGGASQEVLDFIDERNLTVKAIVNTHGHADHIAGNAWFMEKTGAPLLIHIDEEAYLSSEELNLARLVRAEFPVVKADRLLKDGDFIPVGDGKLEVLHTPGHSPGGISLYAPGFVISGDTLFQGSVGRWDLPNGDRDVLQESVLRLARLPLDTVVYPGHGDSTTIRAEIKSNPFL
ncbi:MAG: MBL fold metallo-hydrolase [Firmicutes bacterium]|jgi:hydroxyacylglutathione hydrolase|nr:MBL fold metallo-hydrolase [Bacillota bacterium]NLO65227.1 MBL fold metallo-hydrolase [Bacillota bacterium]